MNVIDEYERLQLRLGEAEEEEEGEGRERERGGDRETKISILSHVAGASELSDLDAIKVETKGLYAATHYLLQDIHEWFSGWSYCAYTVRSDSARNRLNARELVWLSLMKRIHSASSFDDGGNGIYDTDPNHGQTIQASKEEELIMSLYEMRCPTQYARCIRYIISRAQREEKNVDAIVDLFDRDVYRAIINYPSPSLLLIHAASYISFWVRFMGRLLAKSVRGAHTVHLTGGKRARDGGDTVTDDEWHQYMCNISHRDAICRKVRRHLEMYELMIDEASTCYRTTTRMSVVDTNAALDDLLITDEERKAVSDRVQARPTRPEPWGQLPQATRDIWYAVAWMYAAQQRIPQSCGWSFEDRFVVLWDGIGSERFYLILLRNDPFLLHIGDSMWCVFHRDRPPVIYSTPLDAASALHTALHSCGIVQVPAFDTLLERRM